MRKKILIVIPGFKHGGTNRSLFNLLTMIDKDKYDIDIFGMSPDGYYKELLKDQTAVHTNSLLSAIVANLSEEKSVRKKFFYLLVKVILKTFALVGVNIKDILYSYIGGKKQFRQYDTIVAFQEGEATLFVSKIKCSNKIAWIHCNYHEYLKYLKIKPEVSVYKSFDSIVCVSKFTKSVFAKLIPELDNRVYAIHNALDVSGVLVQSVKNILPDTYNSEVFTIISVGRIDVTKRFSSIPEIIFGLKNRGLVFKWFLLGGTNHVEEYRKLQTNIEKYKVGDFLSCLGEVNNPYPYIVNSDLLVSTSMSEAFPYVIIEAKALGVPVLTTDFGSAQECVIHGYEGIITPIEKMVHELEKMIKDKQFYNAFKNNLSNFHYDNGLILNKINNIL